MPPISFHVARDPRELEQVHALHYKAFVEEIPQHPAREAGRHVDRFHEENVYIVAVDGEAVVGSLAVRAKRPFSLDQKLENLDAYLPKERRFCELRLLSIVKEHRSGPVLPGLIAAVAEYAYAEEIDCALISATTRQLRLYRHLGFEPFGPLVGTEEAQFQPMLLRTRDFRARAKEIVALPPAARGETVTFLPGPVAIHADVAAAFASPPQSHRAAPFLGEWRALKASLRAMTGANHVAVMLGSGTLANDAVAAQLGGRGLVLSNGEFGERLADHAARAGLEFVHLRRDWGAPFDFGEVRRAAVDVSWIWAVACETSTGLVTDLPALAAIARESGAELALDCVSALGAIPLDLSGVAFASASSGKAFASYSGLALVFHRDPIAAGRKPRYLDLGLYCGEEVPFTHSSNLVRALRVAVDRVDWARRCEEIAAAGSALHARLRAAGFSLVGEQPSHVLTIALPADVRACAVAQALERAGFLLAHGSCYLRERNWIQIALMGEVRTDDFGVLVRELVRATQ